MDAIEQGEICLTHNYAYCLFFIFQYVYVHWFRVDVNPSVHAAAAAAAADPPESYCSSP
jgi:hypothetical protein